MPARGRWLKPGATSAASQRGCLEDPVPARSRRMESGVQLGEGNEEREMRVRQSEAGESGSEWDGTGRTTLPAATKLCRTSSIFLR